MQFDYFYGQQAEQYSFYRIPKLLITSDLFWNISADAKLLYGILLDRMNLSAKNGWLDEKGRVYIIYTLEETRAALNCGNQKATKLFNELEKKCGLIERKLQGLGKRVCAMLLALVMCTGVFSTTAFAYSNETVSAADVSEATEPEETESVEKQTEDGEDELPYNFTITEDGTIVFSFNGEEYEYDMNSEESQTTGKVVTGGSRLNVRTGAGMNYEIIDQLRPGEEVVVIGTEGDWYQITVPEKTGYVHGDYLEILEAAEENSEMDMALIMMFMSMFMQNMDTDTSEPALTPDGNLTLIDDVGSADKSGKQFITAVTKNGNYFYIIIDRDDDGDETVHFLNQVDEADLLKLMDEEEAAQYIDQTEEPDVTEPTPDVTEPEPDVVEPEPEKPKTNMMPAVLVMVALIGGGGFFVFKKMQEKKKEKEAAKPDPDADYVDDDEDYGYSEEYEDEDDVDFIADDEDNEPV